MMMTKLKREYNLMHQISDLVDGTDVIRPTNLMRANPLYEYGLIEQFIVCHKAGLMTS
jgi:hypothetical protein